MKEFRTTDINLAACLRLTGANLLNIETNGSKGTFVFEGVEEDFVTKFDLGNMLVEPVAFNNMIKQLTTSVRRITNNK